MIDAIFADPYDWPAGPMTPEDYAAKVNAFSKQFANRKFALDPPQSQRPLDAGTMSPARVALAIRAFVDAGHARGSIDDAQRDAGHTFAEKAGIRLALDLQALEIIRGCHCGR